MSAFCAENGCVGIALTGKFCDEHKTNNYIQRRNAARPELDSWYDRAAWRGPYGARGYKLRHDPICEAVGCRKPATDVHHRDGSWKTTGNWRLFIDQNNLVSLCHECHSSITFEENRSCIQGR
jgi:hypothetical protein